MSFVFVIPKPGIRVRHPETGRIIAAEGETVERSTYWLRRQRDGDVSIEQVRPSPPVDAAVAAEGVSSSAPIAEKKKR
jgi:hypothetical protein